MTRYADLKVDRRYYELKQELAAELSKAGNWSAAVRAREGFNAELYDQAKAEVAREEAALAATYLTELAGSELGRGTLLLLNQAGSAKAVRQIIEGYNNQRIAELKAKFNKAGLDYCLRCRQLKPVGEIKLTYAEGTRLQSESDCSYDWWTWIVSFKHLMPMCDACRAEANYNKEVRVPRYGREGDRAPTGTIWGWAFEAEERDSEYWAHYTEGFVPIYVDTDNIDEPETGSRPHRIVETATEIGLEFLAETKPVPADTEVYRFDQYTFTYKIGTTSLEKLAADRGLLPQLSANCNRSGGWQVGVKHDSWCWIPIGSPHLTEAS